MARTAFPDGIDEKAMAPRDARGVVALRFLLFAVVLILAMMGVFGGRKAEVTRADSAAALLTVEAPERYRNGNFFQTRFTVHARQPISDAVIAVPAAFLHETTINSLIPQPTDERSVGGDYLYHFGPLAAGQSLRFKIGGQFNPPLFGVTEGSYRLLDGERELVRVPARLTVIS